MKDHPEWVGETGLRPGGFNAALAGIESETQLHRRESSKDSKDTKKMDARLAFNYLK